MRDLLPCSTTGLRASILRAVVIAFVPLVLLAACESAELTPAPTQTFGACPPSKVFCEDAGPPNGATCPPNADAGAAEAHPVGCVTYVFDGSHSADGTCEVSSKCTCGADDAGVTWRCQ